MIGIAFILATGVMLGIGLERRGWMRRINPAIFPWIVIGLAILAFGTAVAIGWRNNTGR